MEEESAVMVMEDQSATAECDPEIEACYEYSTVIEQGSIMPTIWIGLAALLKAILPVIFRYTAADSGITASSSSLYSSAFAVWWIGNIIIWGLLTVLWPITYFSITVITDLTAIASGSRA